MLFTEKDPIWSSFFRNVFLPSARIHIIKTTLTAVLHYKSTQSLLWMLMGLGLSSQTTVLAVLHGGMIWWWGYVVSFCVDVDVPILCSGIVATTMEKKHQQINTSLVLVRCVLNYVLNFNLPLTSSHSHFPCVRIMANACKRWIAIPVRVYEMHTHHRPHRHIDEERGRNK